jgi:hypothetical protein
MFILLMFDFVQVYRQLSSVFCNVFMLDICAVLRR